MIDKIEIGWDAVAAGVTAIVAGTAFIMTAVTSNTTRIAAQGETILLIRQDTQYLRDRLDRLIEEERRRE